jgi:AraC-like DNA-binding protein
MVRAEPHPRLRGLVRAYCGFFEQSPQPVRRREVPWAGAVVILNFGPRFTVAGEQHTSFAGGLWDSPALTEYEGVSHGLEITFTPLGARRFLGVPLDSLANRVVELEDVLPGTPELVERLFEAPDWPARFTLLDAAIEARAAQSPASPAEIVWAWRRLAETEGRVPIGALADEVGWSRRHLAVRSREQLGMPLKTVARILRFERVVRLLGQDEGGRFAEIAYDCGFADQAHLNRDFRELAGTTPGEYVGSLLPDGFGVAFVQDER